MFHVTPICSLKGFLVFLFVCLFFNHSDLVDEGVAVLTHSLLTWHDQTRCEAFGLVLRSLTPDTLTELRVLSFPSWNCMGPGMDPAHWDEGPGNEIKKWRWSPYETHSRSFTALRQMEVTAPGSSVRRHWPHIRKPLFPSAPATVGSSRGGSWLRYMQVTLQSFLVSEYKLGPFEMAWKPVKSLGYHF